MSPTRRLSELIHVMVGGNGQEVAFHGEYREIIPNECIVYTEVFEGAPDAEALTAVTFTEAAARTTLAILVQYDSGQDRNAHSDYMKDGLQEAMDLLEQTAISLATHLSRPARRPPVPRDSSSEEGFSWER
jgi:uncharacterized protein YndB with AHSA1/START domain